MEMDYDIDIYPIFFSFLYLHVNYYHLLLLFFTLPFLSGFTDELDNLDFELDFRNSRPWDHSADTL